MQACDLLALCPLAPAAAETPKPAPPAARPTTRDRNRHEPPLRYEVESMQHWLDLNA